MRNIRERIPDAKLIQTEDLGRVWSTIPLRYQADYENERRWFASGALAAAAELPTWQGTARIVADALEDLA